MSGLLGLISLVHNFVNSTFHSALLRSQILIIIDFKEILNSTLASSESPRYKNHEGQLIFW